MRSNRKHLQEVSQDDISNIKAVLEKLNDEKPIKTGKKRITGFTSFIRSCCSDNFKLRRQKNKEASSSDCNNLKEILLEEGSEYWNEKEISEGMKEVWARLRCGNLTRAGKAGMEEWKCRMCKKENETIEHIMSCEVMKDSLSAEVKNELEVWREMSEGDSVRKKIVRALKGKICKKLCSVIREMEKKLKGGDEIGECESQFGI
ncbi:hypothetical protein KQX54_016877 [Cotesia glomerata]|uniref:Reverse transcriptase zinc-binding domain-containing protein n=1 Tax=Cotesia glomerata TaxID=32391 RepID=A0AAV7IE48_COTGL|nr:hypothetical protein KQX54_016877 [Cotesia glomerata]